ncbi:MAG: glycerophosphodiester phosphodiesterase [Sporichthyaceae bacterium]
MNGRPLVIAHRTCMRDAPENSLAGIALAAAAGADAVEVDVRRTRDGVAVLFHDRLAWRLARRLWPVWAMRSSALGAALERRHPGGLVTLDAALAACPAALRPALDVKAARAIPLVIAAINSSGRRDALVWCHSARAVARVRAHLPGVATALLRNTRGPRSTMRYLAAAARAEAGAVSLHQRAVSAEVVARARGLGVLPYAWVVTAEGHGAVLGAGVDAVTTDWPQIARALLDSSPSPG